MAWNGSGGSTTPPKKVKASGTSSSSLFHGIAALVLVLVIGGVAYLFVTQDMPKAKEPTEEKVEKKAIEVVEPEIAEKVVEEVKIPEKPKKFWEVDASQTNGFTRMQQRKWEKEHRPPPGYTNNTSRTEAPPSYAIFDHHSENTIAAYLTMTPGDTMVGTPYYGKKFTEDFMESLKTPIIIDRDDTPEQAELKRLMIETKIDLANRIREGEDLGQILLDTHEEYQRLASLKNEVRMELLKLKNDPDVTMEDVDDFYQAANTVLENRGIAPLEMGPIARRMLMRRKGVE